MKKIIIPIFAVLVLGVIAVFYSVFTKSQEPVYAATDPYIGCTFATYCAGEDCTAALPDDFKIHPNGRHGRTYLEMPNRPSSLSVTATATGTEYINTSTERGTLRLFLNLQNAFDYDFTHGDQIATGTGQCTTATPQGGNT